MIKKKKSSHSMPWFRLEPTSWICCFSLCLWTCVFQSQVLFLHTTASVAQLKHRRAEKKKTTLDAFSRVSKFQIGFIIVVQSHSSCWFNHWLSLVCLSISETPSFWTSGPFNYCGIISFLHYRLKPSSSLQHSPFLLHQQVEASFKNQSFCLRSV